MYNLNNRYELKVKTEVNESKIVKKYFLTESQMRVITKHSVQVSDLIRLDGLHWGIKKDFFNAIKKRLKRIDSERMMRNLFAKAVYQNSEDYNKEIKCQYAKISEFVNNYGSVKFRRIHKRRYKLYSKELISDNLIGAYKRILADQYELKNRGVSILDIHLDPEDIIITKTDIDSEYESKYKYRYDFQIIKNWKPAWLYKLRFEEELK